VILKDQIIKAMHPPYPDNMQATLGGDICSEELRLPAKRLLNHSS
jgi:hypothetical protein